MRALGIIGSPRKDGNTAYLLNKTLGILEDGKVETETIFLKDYEINPCGDCREYCEKHNKCKIEDGMKDLFLKLRRSNVIIPASPTYMGGVTSRMRTFMERTWPLRNGTLKNKIGTSIVVGRREIGISAIEMNEYFDKLKIIKIPGVIGYAFEKNDILEDQEAIKSSERLGDQLLDLIKKMEEKRYEEPIVI
jgi:multimeric flavodoxin WrbA